jgi:hypothetical protein
MMLPSAMVLRDWNSARLEFATLMDELRGELAVGL